MQKFLRTGGFTASLILIAMGIGAVVVGFDGRDQVRTELGREKIVGTPDMHPSIAGKPVDSGQDARHFAAGMREHTLEITGGQTYAEMGRFLDKAGKPTSDEKLAAVKNGKPVENPARQVWVTQTALASALNMSYFAESVAMFSIVMGIALLLSGIGFGVLTLKLLPSRRKAAQTSPATVPAAPAAA